jgi:hypothetical protein
MSTKLTLGDLLQRVAVGVHRELEATRAAMRRMDPELRTKHLRAFVSNTMKKLMQVYAICNWINTQGQFFSSLNELHRQVSVLEGQLCETQDQLWWKHAQLFPMRSRPLEVVAAMDIIAAGSYTHLPSVIFTCGRLPMPGTKLERAGIVKDLEVFIRAKIGLVDSLPVGVTDASISNGVLKMGRRGVYEVYVTLPHLAEDAPWLVLDSSIVAKSRESEEFVQGYDVNTLNWQLGTILMQRCKASISVIAPDADTGEERSSDQLDKMAVENESATSSGGGGAAKGKESSMGPLTLTHIDQICSYVGLSAVHRLLFAQALDMSRSLWRSHLDVVFLEDLDSFELRVRAWRSQLTGKFQCELRVVQDRVHIRRVLGKKGAAMTDSGVGGRRRGRGRGDERGGAGLRLELFLLVHEAERDAELVRHHRIRDTSEFIDPDQEALNDGAAFAPLLQQTLFVLGRTKIAALYARFAVTKCIGSTAEDPVLKTVTADLRESSLRLSRSDGGSGSITICVDARTGVFLLNATAVTPKAPSKAPSGSSGKSKAEVLLLQEMNAAGVQQTLTSLLCGSDDDDIANASMQAPGLALLLSGRLSTLTTGQREGMAGLISPLVNLEGYLKTVFSDL